MAVDAAKGDRLDLYGFGADAVPRRQIAPRMVHPAIPGKFPSTKSAKGWLRTGSPLMMDALYHFDTDPSVTRLTEFPVEVQWWCTDAKGNRYKRSDIPDLGAVTHDGQLSFHKVTPLAIQRENPSFDDRAKQLAGVFLEQHGAVYTVLDERDILVNPRFQNVRVMWSHSRGDMDDDAVDAVRVAFERARRSGAATSIDTLTNDCALDPLWVVHDDDAVAPKLLAGNCRVFSAIMGLAVTGEVDVDLSKPFSGSTAVTPGVLHSREGRR